MSRIPLLESSPSNLFDRRSWLSHSAAALVSLAAADCLLPPAARAAGAADGLEPLNRFPRMV